MEKKWWHHLTAYQIYTRSFCDSNGDGIGDFQGIISKLDYLQELGIGAIWISPFNDSPNYDNGYDISDYYAILKDFGTMADLEAMIQECEKRDIIGSYRKDEVGDKDLDALFFEMTGGEKS